MNLRPTHNNIMQTELQDKIRKEIEEKSKTENPEEDVEMTLEEFIYGNVDINP